MKTLSRLALIAIGSIPASWLIAVSWQQSGDWWVRTRPDAYARAVYLLCRPFLSNDVTVAEDQLEFLLYWMPTFVVVVVAVVIWSLLRRSSAAGQGKESS